MCAIAFIICEIENVKEFFAYAKDFLLNIGIYPNRRQYNFSVDALKGAESYRAFN